MYGFNGSDLNTSFVFMIRHLVLELILELNNDIIEPILNLFIDLKKLRQDFAISIGGVQLRIGSFVYHILKFIPSALIIYGLFKYKN